MKEKTKRMLHKIEFSLALVCLLLVAFFFVKPTITGFIPKQLITQNISLRIDKSSIFKLTSNSDFCISAFRVSGKTFGNGLVEIFLTDSANRLLVFSNKRKIPTGLTSITGLLAAESGNWERNAADEKFLLISYEEAIAEHPKELKDDETLFEGAFSSVCRDTCYIDMCLTKNSNYKLIVLVQNASVLLKNIEFLLRKG